MEMTIDEAILRVEHSSMSIDDKETADFIINTMRKYQKIKQIAFPLQFCSTDKLEHEAIMKICEVLEDGEID